MADGVYLHDWATPSYSGKTGADAVMQDFSVEPAALKGAKVIFASYEQEGYEGSAFVLFRRAGKLYEVHGGHCSCHGLEGQWDPKETTVPELKHRLEQGTIYGLAGCEDKLKAVVAKLRVRK